VAFDHLALDLVDRAACESALVALPPVTHLVYAAVKEAPGLVEGWRDEALMAENGAMFANVLDPLARQGNLRHVTLLQGSKAYGAHRHPVAVPLREDLPRDDHANFYWLHEDRLRSAAGEAGFAFTILRPQVLLGSAPGVAMNPVAALGIYAALCRELGRPFAYPGPGAGVMELVDAGLLAEAFEWATQSPTAAGQMFNVTNGDVMVLSDAWAHIAAWFGHDLAGEAPASLASFFAEDASESAWARLVERHGLRISALADLLGQSHHYVDLLLGARIGTRPVPVLLSTIKLRQAGFAVCRDSLASLRHWLVRMIELKLLPPLFAEDLK
jgi:nucleoside-diphosphate-sugar epimerase